MKSRRKIASLFLTLFVLVLTISALFSCGGDVYTVNFDSNGGSRVESTTVAAGEKLTPPEVPTKEDYVFTGWYDKNGAWDFETAVTGDMTLVAMWKKSADADVISVVFNSNGGSAVDSVNVERGATIGAPKAPTRAGYAFIGWFENGEEFDFSKALVNGVNLTAKWEIVTYSVSYDLAGGTNAKGNPTEFTVESESIKLTAPTKNGYTFTGWTAGGEDAPVKELEITKGSTGNKTYTANWQIDTYNLTWNLSDGVIATAPATSYTVVTEDIAVANPTKADYVFLGWSAGSESEPVKDLVITKGSTGDKVYTAVFAPVEYNITYVLGGGENSASNPDTYSHETALTLSDPVRVGYSFTGWTFEGQDTPTKAVSIAQGTKGDKTYTANWEIITYTITYNKNGAESYASTLPATFTVNDLPIYPGSLYIQNANKSFVGWFSDEALTAPVSVINTCENITLYSSFVDATEGLVIAGGVVKGYTGTAEVVYIPEYFGGVRVSAIAESAFENNATLKELYLPYGVTAIGTAAFSGAVNLTSVYTKADTILETIGNNAFAACTSLKTISIPKSVKTIGNNAFMACMKLETVEIADGSALTTIGKNAFDGCLALKSISLPASISEIGERAFASNQSLEAVYFADGALLTKISKETFASCSKLAQIRIPASVTVISESAFNGAKALKDLSFEDGSKLATIEANAFNGVKALVSLQMPDSLVTINSGAFQNADGLEVLVFSEDSLLQTVGVNAFYNCQNLKTVTFGNALKTIEGSAFYNCASLEELTLGNAVETIGRSAFSGAAKLNALKLPVTLTTLEKDAFRGCSAIVTLSVGNANADLKTAFNGTLPATVKTLEITGTDAIEAGLFADCKAVETLIIPFVGLDGTGKIADIFGGTVPETLKTVKINGSNAIPAGAFEGCASVETLILSKEITIIEDGAFAPLTALKSLEISLANELGTPVTTRDEAPAVLLSVLFGGAVPKSLETVTVTASASLTTPAVPANAFAQTSVKTVILDKDICAIDRLAFSYMEKLDAVVIPEDSKLTVIAEGAFAYTNLLKSLTFKNPTLEIKQSAFAYSAIETLTFAENAVTTLGEYAFGECSALKSFDTKAAGLTSIPDGAFYHCRALENIVISDKISSIGDHAFEGCEKLTAITFGEDSEITAIGDYAFSGTAIKSFAMPDAITVIQDGTFKNCKYLSEVSFSESSLVEKIGTSAFENTAITSFVLPASVTEIQSYAFKDTAKLSEFTFAEGTRIEKVSTGAFEGASLVSIAIPDEITVIANDTFKNCKSLTTVSFGAASKLEAIAPGAFKSCIKLTSFALPVNVASIGDGAFEGCYSLASVSFPEGTKLETIGERAFYNCDAITKLEVPVSVKAIGEKAFFGCDALTEVVFPENITLNTISSYAFASSAKLEKINIPASVKVIGDHAFANCVALKTVTFAAAPTLETIEASAFRGCKALTGFVVPASVKLIETSAFADCEALESITLSVDIDFVGAAQFTGCEKLVITVNYSDDADKDTVPSTWDSTWNGSSNKVVFVDLTPPAAQE